MIIGKLARDAGYIVCPVCKQLIYSKDVTQHLCCSAECIKTYNRVKRFVKNYEAIKALWRKKKVKPYKCVYCQRKLTQGYKMRIICSDRMCGIGYSRVKKYLQRRGELK